MISQRVTPVGRKMLDAGSDRGNFRLSYHFCPTSYELSATGRVFGGVSEP